MTGQKDRYSTQEKLWRLDDEQLTTPKHDELVLSATPEFILSQCEQFIKELQNKKYWQFPYSTQVFESQGIRVISP